MKQAVQVTILGHQYNLRSEVCPEEVRKVAAFVNEKLAEVAAAKPTIGPLDMAVLALMNVGAAYLKLHSEGGRTAGDEGRLRSILERLESACPLPEPGRAGDNAGMPGAGAGGPAPGW